MNSIPHTLYADDDATVAQFFATRLSGRDSVLSVGFAVTAHEPIADGRELEAGRDSRGILIGPLAGTLDSARLRPSHEVDANEHLVKFGDFRRFAGFARTQANFWLTMNKAPTASGRRR